MSDTDQVKSTRARYRQLAARLEMAILDGTLTHGDELENEIKLAAHYGVSRDTMRRAILELVDRGLLVRKRGVGTRVVATGTPDRHGPCVPIRRELRLGSLHFDLCRLNQQPTTVVLTHEPVRPPQAVVEMLSLRPGRLAHHLVRLRYARREPLAIMESYLPADIIDFNTFDPVADSLAQVMRDNGISFRLARQRIGARIGSERENQLLGDPADSPVLTMDRTSHDATGRIIEVATHIYRAHLHEYTLTLTHRSRPSCDSKPS